MDREEGDAHGENHRDERQPVERSGDESQRADHLGEDRQHERRAASEAQRVGERRRERCEMLPFGDAVGHHQRAEEDVYKRQVYGFGYKLVQP